MPIITIAAGGHVFVEAGGIASAHRDDLPFGQSHEAMANEVRYSSFCGCVATCVSYFIGRFGGPMLGSIQVKRESGAPIASHGEVYKRLHACPDEQSEVTHRQ